MLAVRLSSHLPDLDVASARDGFWGCHRVALCYNTNVYVHLTSARAGNRRAGASPDAPPPNHHVRTPPHYFGGCLTCINAKE
jgi:hypothetical protein